MNVLTIGTFDILHFGHIRLIKRCKELAGPKGKVFVGLNPDEFIMQYKHAYPVMSYEEREKAIKELEYVTDVLPNKGGANSKVLIELVKPDLLVIGSDWARKDYYKQMQFTQDWLDEKNIILAYVPYTAGISTTNIKKRLETRK
jgi:glycerol-3-phosphate cytidylyltransferase